MNNVNIIGFTKKFNDWRFFIKNQYIREDCLERGLGQFGGLRGESVKKKDGCPIDLSNLCTYLSCLIQFLSPAI